MATQSGMILYRDTLKENMIPAPKHVYNSGLLQKIAHGSSKPEQAVPASTQSLPSAMRSTPRAEYGLLDRQDILLIGQKNPHPALAVFPLNWHRQDIVQDLCIKMRLNLKRHKSLGSLTGKLLDGTNSTLKRDSVELGWKREVLTRESYTLLEELKQELKLREYEWLESGEMGEEGYFAVSEESGVFLLRFEQGELRLEGQWMDGWPDVAEESKLCPQLAYRGTGTRDWLVGLTLEF